MGAPQEVHIDGGSMALVKTEGGSGNVSYFMLLPDDVQAQQSEQTVGNFIDSLYYLYYFMIDNSILFLVEQGPLCHLRL